MVPQKHGYRPKPEFFKGGFLKFGHLVLTPKVLVGSENWLVCLSYDQESIQNMAYFFENFLCLDMKEIRCLSSTCECAHKNMVIVQKQIFLSISFVRQLTHFITVAHYLFRS